MREDRGQRIEDRGQRVEDRGRELERSLATAVPRAAWGHDLHDLQDGGLRGLRGRRGITLLEVLISIFVIAIGLLGVAAMIPIGTLAVSETAKADRSAALGRAAMHEVRVRDMLERMRTPNYARWHLARNGLALDDTGGAPITRSHTLIGQSFAIDPMFATEAAVQQTAVGYDAFPYAPATPPVTDLIPLLALMRNEPRLLRLRLDIFEGALTMLNYFGKNDSLRAALSTQQIPVLDRIFTWQDDLIFDLDEDDPDRRPRQSCVWSNGAVAAAPALPDDPDFAVLSTQTALRSQAEDNYSWMLTAEPDPNELPPVGSLLPKLTAHRQKTYTVSIVTFYKRDFNADATVNPPSERFVGINFNGTGIGGGDATLMIPTASVTQEQAQDYLKVKDNEWIMVTGFVVDPRLDVIFGTGAGKRRVAKWYRVIRVDDEVQLVAGAYTRQLTLAGPDWNIVRQPSATIIDGAIGVYTTTVTLP